MEDMLIQAGRNTGLPLKCNSENDIKTLWFSTKKVPQQLRFLQKDQRFKGNSIGFPARREVRKSIGKAAIKIIVEKRN